MVLKKVDKNQLINQCFQSTETFLNNPILRKALRKATMVILMSLLGLGTENLELDNV